jgi:hypothetical protein
MLSTSTSMSSEGRWSRAGRVVRTVEDAVASGVDAAGFAAAVDAVAVLFAATGRLTVAAGFVVAGAEAALGAEAAFGAEAAVAGLGVVAAGFAALAGADDFALAGGDPVPGVRARVTFGFGCAAGMSGGAAFSVRSGGVVRSAMRLA